jgi:hypothetical protein
VNLRTKSLCFSGIGEERIVHRFAQITQIQKALVLLRNTGLWIAGTYRAFPFASPVPTTKEYALPEWIMPNWIDMIRRTRDVVLT